MTTYKDYVNGSSFAKLEYVIDKVRSVDRKSEHSHLAVWIGESLAIRGRRVSPTDSFPHFCKYRKVDVTSMLYYTDIVCHENITEIYNLIIGFVFMIN